MPFTIATYNVLASVYIRPERYPRTSSALLEPRRRTLAVAERLATLDADLLCLQEVEATLFAAADRRLAPSGYTGELARKGRRKPDGCALFYREGIFERIRSRRREYQDGSEEQPRSGYSPGLRREGRGARTGRHQHPSQMGTGTVRFDWR